MSLKKLITFDNNLLCTLITFDNYSLLKNSKMACFYLITNITNTFKGKIVMCFGL